MGKIVQVFTQKKNEVKAAVRQKAMSFIMKIILCLVLNFALVATCSSQEKNNKIVVKSIETQLEKEMNHHYEIRILDINKSINNPSVSDGRISNPYKNLTNCFIFIAAAFPDSNLYKPKGFIGIYKKDTILWQSGPLTKDLTTLGGYVTLVDELNKDGKVEIVVSQDELPGGATSNYLWIFNWDGRKGYLITELDKRGESKLAFMGEYTFKDIDGDGIYEIQGEWYKDNNFDKTSRVTYSWNGSLYGKWGKSSKYLLKGKRK
jgi:hypothetical protein